MAAPSATSLPPPEQTGGGVDAGGGAGTGVGTHIVTRSKDKAPQGSASAHPPNPPRRCRIDSATALLAPYSRWSKAKLVGRGTFKASMHVNTLARAQCGRLDEMLLLLTLLGV